MARAELAVGQRAEALRDMEACVERPPRRSPRLARLPDACSSRSASRTPSTRPWPGCPVPPNPSRRSGCSAARSRNATATGRAPPLTIAGRWSSIRTCSTPTIGWPRSRPGSAIASRPPRIASAGTSSARPSVQSAPGRCRVPHRAGRRRARPRVQRSARADLRAATRRLGSVCEVARLVPRGGGLQPDRRQPRDPLLLERHRP